LGFITSEGLAPGASATEHADLRAALLRFIPLYVDLVEQITPAERKELRDARKAENSRHRTAAPSLAGVPWLQRLVADQARGVDPWLMGRRLAVAVRVDATPLVDESWETSSRRDERATVVKRLQQDIGSGNVAAVLLAVQAFETHIEKTARTVYNEARSLTTLYYYCTRGAYRCWKCVLEGISKGTS
jgi:hypothetical protein